MSLRVRRTTSAGLGAFALVTSAALAATSGPAYAGGTGADLELSVSSTSVAAAGPVTGLTTTVVNKGPADSAAWAVEYDFSGLDAKVVTVGPAQQRGCELTGDKLRCTQPGLAVGHSLAEKAPFTLEPVPGKKGAAGSFTVTAVSETDPDQADNKATVTVEVPARGVDLLAVAEDVYRVTDEGELTDEPVSPGETSFVVGAVGNVGDTIAMGLKISVQLPRHVSFAEVEPGCAYGADKRTVTCDYKDINLVPIDQDTRGDDQVHSVVGIYFPVTVAKDAPGPVVLDGGTFTGTAIATEHEITPKALARSRTATLPEGVKARSAKDVRDANPDDNTAEFRVHVGAAASDGSGAGGGLPVTGAQAGLIGGVGAGVVALGAAMFLVSRRRRVVLVTPGDETRTS